MAYKPPSRNPSGLSIRPPSPKTVLAPPLVTPTAQISSSNGAVAGPSNPSSPRRMATSPISPSQSSQGGLWGGQGSQHGASNAYGGPSDDRFRGNSLDVPPGGGSTGNPGGFRDRRLPGATWAAPHSPHRNKSHTSGAGAYDNKLVSSTLSHLPPLPSPSGSTSPYQSTPTLLNPRPTSPRPVNSVIPILSSSSGIVLPDGTTLSRDAERPGRNMADAIAHSSPSSPWSVLTVHVLPLFAGGPLKTPIEDLNHLCHSHIVAVSQRVPLSRVIPVLTQDLRDFIASGMLTLKAKFETLEEAKIIPRAAEVWSFFWSQVLPYLEGVYLPFTQIRDVPSTTQSSGSTNSIVSIPLIPVRHLLLSGFMLHILLPLLPRLIPLISSSNLPPSLPELQRILQMSLVLSTQARYSSIFQTRENRDEEVRENVETLGRTVRWRMQHGDSAISEQPAPGATRVQRGMSVSGRRRKGIRGSFVPREDGFAEDDDDDDPTPNQSYAAGAAEWPPVGTQGTQSTVVAS
ncbi:HbrB-like-domain-containing protein [Kockovaella imperatae]|uniref:HbrB-like-domain-containing protein n=1 Tax=Kockovaella imperatae TaxID=4999 RepID=A0A1Y1ULE5_9TREE|nr:HbrB-like-domain-containing protein [Kockovaella imperatae]ORX38306.1 HbrB-like-domain-containing protein [Kockovaella imperatae]